jgi:hypothetical protein
MKTKGKRVRELRKLLDEIPGEPCGQPLVDCSHKAEHERWHLAYREYSDLNAELWSTRLIWFWRNWRRQILAAILGALAGYILGRL